MKQKTALKVLCDCRMPIMLKEKIMTSYAVWFWMLGY